MNPSERKSPIIQRLRIPAGLLYVVWFFGMTFFWPDSRLVWIIVTGVGILLFLTYWAIDFSSESGSE